MIFVLGDRRAKLDRDLAQERATRQLAEEQLQAQKAEIQTIKLELEKGRQRDEFLLKVFESMSKNRKIRHVVQALRRDGLDCDLIDLK